MLPLKAREKSFSSVRSFAGASGGSPDNFYRRVNVTVRHGQEEYLYRGIYMSIGYQYNYMDYMPITWTYGGWTLRPAPAVSALIIKIIFSSI